MIRLFVATLFLLAVVAQDAFLNDDQTGLRVSLSATQANSLNECADTDDTDQRQTCPNNAITYGTEAIESILPTALCHSHSHFCRFKIDSVPLYQRYAAWLI